MTNIVIASAARKARTRHAKHTSMQAYPKKRPHGPLTRFVVLDFALSHWPHSTSNWVMPTLLLPVVKKI